MKQICDGYNPKVLMGNWYEQSFAVSQPARDDPTKVARVKNFDINFIDKKGKLRELNTISRLQPWNTDNLVTHPLKGHENQKPKTINKENYELKTTNNFHNTFQAQPFTKEHETNKEKKSYMQIDKFQRHHRMFNEKNINELLVERCSDQTSFKTNLKPNLHPNHKQFLQSIYEMQISQPSPFYLPKNKFTNKGNENTINQGNQSGYETVDRKQMQVKNFRRIRSQITLKTTTNFPFTCK